MKDTQKEILVRKLVEKWLPALGLKDWMINISVVEEYHEQRDIQADIEDDLKYHEADMTIYKSFWEDSADKQERTIVHELVHLLLCRLHPHLSPSGDDVVEEVVQTIAMNFYFIWYGKI